jgi:chromate reductase
VPESTLKVCGIAGSLRAGSYNKALLRAAQELAPPGMEIRFFDRLEQIPLYDADREAMGEPEVVAALKKAIGEADALLVSTPEYNYSIPGVLKNAIDWASRPAGRSVLNRKPAALMGASPGMSGTMRAQLALRQSLLFTETYLLPKPEVYVARCQEKFDAAGNLTDEPTRKAVRQLLEALAEWAARFR